MMVHTVSQLLRPLQLSPDRFDQALRTGAPNALRICDEARGRLSAPRIRDAVLAKLPSALEVGIGECVCGRWWPRQSAETGTIDTLEWNLAPRFEWLEKGGVELEVVVIATVRFEQPDMEFHHDPVTRLLRIGTDKAWISTLLLAVADANTQSSASGFYESRSEVYLQPRQWTVGRN